MEVTADTETLPDPSDTNALDAVRLLETMVVAPPVMLFCLPANAELITLFCTGLVESLDNASSTVVGGLQYKCVSVPLIVIVPILVPDVSERVNDTASALSDMPSNLALSIPSSLVLSADDIRPLVLCVTTSYLVSTAEMTLSTIEMLVPAVSVACLPFSAEVTTLFCTGLTEVSDKALSTMVLFAPDSMPFNLVLSDELMRPLADVVATEVPALLDKNESISDSV